MEKRPPFALITILRELPDPRAERTKLHRLEDILVIAICALLCGADSFGHMGVFGEAKVARKRSPRRSMKPMPIMCCRSKATKARPLQNLRNIWMKPLNGRTGNWVLGRKLTKNMAAGEAGAIGRAESSAGLPIEISGSSCAAWESLNQYGKQLRSEASSGDTI